MRNKQKLTQAFVNQLPEQKRIDVNLAKVTWWMNVKNDGGLRLTGPGFKILAEDLDLKFYEYRIPDPMLFSMRVVLELDRKLKDPYYINVKKGYPVNIIFFGSQEAMLINLYGSLEKFLENYT